MDVLRPLRDVPYAASVATLAVLMIAASALALSGGGDASGGGETPTATATPVAAHPTPTPTPPSYGDVLADTKRLLDLAAIAGALDVYHGRNGAYPATFGPVELICTEGTDPACALLALDAQLPLLGVGDPYWYQSDGQSYTLFSALVIAPEDSDCPDHLPEALQGDPVGCISEGE